jgi:hypothetical protein
VGRFPAHRAHQRAARGDEVTGGSRERLTGWQPSVLRKEMTQPPGTGISVRDPSSHFPRPNVLFMDEPAPGLDQLRVGSGRAVVIVFRCAGLCPAPHRGCAARALLGSRAGLVLRNDDWRRAHRPWLRCGRRGRAAALPDPRWCTGRVVRADPAPRPRPRRIQMSGKPLPRLSACARYRRRTIPVSNIEPSAVGTPGPRIITAIRCG